MLWTKDGDSLSLNTLRPRQNGRHFPDDIFKCIFFNENVWILIKVSLKFVPKGPISTIPALVQIMAWRRPGNKPLLEPMVVSLLKHICITRPQWVNDAYMCQWTGSPLAQVMAYRLIKLWWNLNQNMQTFTEDTAFENIICKMSAILFRVNISITRLIRVNSSWTNFVKW